MPVLDQTTSNSYTGNGVTTVFAYTFKLLDQADVLVEVDGVAKTLTTHYTVSGVGNSGGGNITFLSAPANATEVVIQRDMAYLRETDYQDNGDLLAATLDEDIDRVVMQGQQTRDGVARAAKLPVTVTGVDPTLPVPVANRGLKWNAAADGFENGDSDLDAIEAAVAASAAAAASSESAAAASESSANASALSATASASTATTQAGIATTKASEASTSAANALTSENNAETAETNAAASLADALVIYGSIAAVQAAAAAAQLAETNAETAETNAETAETNAAASAAAAAVSETAADSAYSNSIAIYGSLAAVQSAASSASASAVTAAAEADEATNQAAAAAASALSAASVVSQDLSAIDRTVFASVTLISAFLYDTSRDSDGGAWRHRCAHTSWYNETLSGNWLGSAANEAGARAISGAATGSYYYDTTAKVFYKLNAGSGVTQVYRGNAAKFPAKVLITAEYAGAAFLRIVLWDLTQSGAPMWMVFYRNDTSEFLRFSFEPSLSMLNGMLAVGGGTSGGQDYYGCLRTADFAADKMRQWGGGASYGYNYTSPVGIASRNTSAVNFQPVVNQAARVLPGLVDSRIYDVAMTALPNAPVNLATGLPIPTIAVATTGNATYSTSVIKDDGTVVNIASDATGTAVSVEFDGLALKVIRSDGTVYYWNDVRALTTGASPSATVSASTTPAALGTASKQAKRALSSSTGLTLMRRDQLTLASSMLAYVTKDYTSGWMPGAIKGAWLAGIVAETLTGAELITNGDFATDSSASWLNVGNAQNITAAAGALRFESTGGSSIVLRSASSNAVVANLVNGKTYTLSAKLTQTVGAGGATYQLRVYNNAASVLLGSASITTVTGVSQKVSITFTATENNYPLLYPWVTTATALADAFELDDLSIRLADVDRSIKAKGVQAFGSITKAAVASGAQLVGYSGWSVANYFEQPVNPDLDFGTGDFCIMGWAKFAATAAKEVIFCRDSPTTGKLIRLQVDVTTSYLSASAFDGTTTRTATGAAAIDDTTWKHVLLTYSAGTLTIYVNGVSYATATGAALLTLNNASAVLRIGCDVAGSYPATNAALALWRATATVPSAEQIKHIYETERALFEANAQCCLAGTSNAVTALAYDEETDLLHVGTSYGRSAFKGLVRVSSEATPVGAITALSASAGVVVQGGATAVDVYVPAYTLREELLRDAEQMAKFGQNLIAHDFTATASQTTFTLPVGWEIVAVYQQGAIKRETTSWTRSFDGFKWSAVLDTGATVSDWISILAKRV